MHVVRVLRGVAFAGAATLGALAGLPGHATAQTPAIAYNGQTSAAGVLYSFDVNPALSPIPNLIYVRSPLGDSSLTSSGESHGDASLASPGNIVTLDALLCVAGVPCGKPPFSNLSNPILGKYPYVYPLQASASYPEDQGKVQNAHVGNSTPVALGSAATFFPGHAQSQALATQVRTDAADNATSMLGGTPAAISTGQVTATTYQVVDRAGLTTEATASANDISLAGLVHIDAVASTATVTNSGTGKVRKAVTTTISGVTALGQPATITNHGIQLASASDNGILGNTVNQQLQQALAKSGLSIRLVGTSTRTAAGAITETSGGLLVTYSEPVNFGRNDPTNIIRSLYPCFPTPTTCDVNAPGLNGTYYGTYAIGFASVQNYAAPVPMFNLHLPTVGLPLGGSTGATTRYIPGTAGTPGTPGTPGQQVTTGSASQAGVAPALPGGRSGYASGELANASNRLKYLFPAFFLGVLGLLAGRFFRYPARFPGR